MIGARLQPRSPSMTCVAVHVGQAEVEDHGVGRVPRGRGQRAGAPSAATVDLVAAGAQVDRQRAAQARLVLDDQDAASSVARRASGRRMRIVSPPPGVSVGDERAAHRLDEAARDRESEPDPVGGCGRRGAGTARTARLALGGGTPGP